MSDNERRGGYERLTNNVKRVLNQQRTVQEWLSNSYQTVQDRYRITQKRLSNGYRTAIGCRFIRLRMVTYDYVIDWYRKTKNGY